LNVYRGKHVSSQPWPVASHASSRRGRHQKKNRHARRFWILAIVLVVLLVGYPFLESRLLQTDKVRLQPDDLPAEANHLRIVYLSDIHYGFWFSDNDLSRLLSQINGLRPDLVLFGGDYATDHHTAIEFFTRLSRLTRIHARYGVYGVVGEHDRGESDFDVTQLTEAMTNAEVIPLVNRVVPVNVGASRIYIAGADDYLTGKPDLTKLASSVSASDYVIFLSHNPSVISEAQLAMDASGSLGWFDLGLFGHTHGGQMMFFSSALGIADEVPDRYAQGWKKENRADLLISRGVGVSVVPFRLFCFPQIHLIELTV